jgi:protein-S-isoprenylcysteine O-methyltransferase Ste14
LSDLRPADFSILDAVVWVELTLCWPLWVYPFFVRSRVKRKDSSAITAPAARWGIGVQAIGFFMASLRSASPKVPALIVAFFLGLCSAWMVRRAVKHLGKQWRIQAGLYSDHELVRTGPYMVVRHPIYLSMFGMLLMNGLLLAWWPILMVAAAIFLAGTEVRVRSEDALLASRFGEVFLNYQASVPAYIPFIR